MPPSTSVSRFGGDIHHNRRQCPVGPTIQISGTTANNFTLPVTYTVTAADGTTQDYTVFVAVEAVAEPFSSSLTAVDENPLGSKIPLILIHGYKGKTITGYWQNFISYFNSNTSLTSKYKLYEFKYDSDKISDTEIGLALKNNIGALSDFAGGKSFVIMAHSMGGLVARSYMQEQGESERIIKIITLATPDHGSPLETMLHVLVASIIRFSRLPFLYLTVLFGAEGIYFTILYALVEITLTLPSLTARTALGSYNDPSGVTGYNTCPECNTWLQSLNSSSGSYNDKLILYYGFLNSGNSTIYDTIANITVNDLGYYLYEHRNDTSVVLAGAAVILYHVYLAGDGLVPYDSGAFYSAVGVSDSQRREFQGYNHDQMKEGVVVNGTIPLFDRIRLT